MIRITIALVAAVALSSGAAAVTPNPPANAAAAAGQVVQPAPNINPNLVATVPQHHVPPGVDQVANPPNTPVGEPGPPTDNPPPPDGNAVPLTNNGDASTTISDTGSTSTGDGGTGGGETGGGGGSDFPWIFVAIVVGGVFGGGILVKHLWPPKPVVVIGPQPTPATPDPRSPPPAQPLTPTLRPYLDLRPNDIAAPDLQDTGPRTTIQTRLERGEAIWPE